jgi:peptidoglycan LD-endopeptidase CwlK
MRYDSRNRATIKELAPNTRAAAEKWYDYCVKNNVEILIYEARRTEAEQRANVARGASQTMKSYHLVGQAIDFVPVDSKGNAIWSTTAYKKEPFKSAIAQAKKLGFEWGGDWKGFVDCPHLQFNYKGYGTDKVLTVAATPTPSTASVHTVVKGDTLWGISRKYNVGIEKIKSLNGLRSDTIQPGQKLQLKDAPAPKPATQSAVVPYPGVLKKGSKGKEVERVQRALGIKVDGDFGPATENAVRAYQKRKGLSADGIVGPNTWYMIF